MHSPAGLNLDSLATNQRDLLRKFFSDPSVDSGDIPAVLKCPVTPGRKSPQYPFEIINTKGLTQLFEWSIGLPLYVEPPKPDAKPRPNINSWNI